MKKSYITILFAALILFITGCKDFLDTRPQGSLDEVAFQNERGIEMLMTSVYSALSPYGVLIDAYVNWASGSLAGGEANKGSSASDFSDLTAFELYKVNSSNGFISGKWGILYNLIAKANSTIKTINKSDNLSADYKNVKIGELKFLRAYGFFELRKSFHYVPYIDETFEDNDPKVYNNEDIYPKIIADLKDAMVKLPKITGSGRANYWAAKALLARVYVYQSDFVAAEPILKDIIDNGVTSTGATYKLMANFSDVYRIATEASNTEAMFSINYFTDSSASFNNVGWAFCWPLGLFPPFSGYGFYQPSFDLVNSYQVNDEGLPYLDNGYRNRPSVTTIDGSGNATSTLSIAVDPRLDWTVARPGMPIKDYGMWQPMYIRDMNYGGPFFVNKMLHWKAEGGGAILANTMNFHVIRLADVFLMYAECLAQNGKPANARQYVNMIRDRASKKVVTLSSGLPAATFKIGIYPDSQFDSKDKALQAIRFERKLELALEGYRFYDLVRWGSSLAKTELDGIGAYEKKYLSHYDQTQPFEAFRSYYPIPLTQIQTVGKDKSGNDYLKQNDGY